MRYISPLLSDARGSLGGATATKAHAASFVRAKVSPTRSATPSQQGVRSLQTALSQTWRTLTPANRKAWDQAAAGTVLTDTLGRDYRPSGFQLYISRNRNLSLINVAPLAAPGTRTSLQPSFTISSATMLGPSPGTFHFMVQLSYVNATTLTQTVMRATSGLRTSLVNVPAPLFRVIQGPYTATSTTIQFAPAYLAVFPVPAVGSQISFNLEWIDPLTGVAHNKVPFSVIKSA